MSIRRHIPKDNDPSHTYVIVGKKCEMDLLEFTKTYINEKIGCNFSKTSFATV